MEKTSIKYAYPKLYYLILCKIQETVYVIYIEERMLARVSFSDKFGDGFSTEWGNT